jgi:hypothetical protein
MELPKPAQSSLPQLRRIADLARRQLVVERRGQAQIIRFCAGVAARVKAGS